MTLALAALSGCAQLLVDPDGSRHLFGFMLLTLPPVRGDIGADSIRMRALGLAITRGDTVGAALVLGYSDTTLAAVRNDSLVSKAALLDPQGTQAEERP